MVAWVGGALAFALFAYVQLTPSAPEVGVSDKVQHATLYALAALLAWLVVPGPPQAKSGAIIAAGWLVALLMEAGQAHVPHRRQDTLDALADLGGMLLAVLLATLLVRMKWWMRGRRLAHARRVPGRKAP